MFGDLIASGWLTAGLSARGLVLGFMNDIASLGGRGMDELRGHEPVYAGDELSISVGVVETREGSTPGFGHVESEVTTTNQRDEEVLTMTGLGIVAKEGHF
jgi:acyl dehydratase